MSGAALRTEGQLTTYHYRNGPCYRCVFPEPPPQGAVTACSDGGVLGVVTGIVGTMQALEVVKVLTGVGDTLHQRLQLVDGLSGTVRTIKLRGRQPSCVVCGSNPSITALVDYEQFCGRHHSTEHHRGEGDGDVVRLPPSRRLSALALHPLLPTHTHDHTHILVDVRPAVEFGICALPHSINIPMSTLLSATTKDALVGLLGARMLDPTATFVFVCRRGNDSQIAADHATRHGTLATSVDLLGGLQAWAVAFPSFPVY